MRRILGRVARGGTAAALFLLLLALFRFAPVYAEPPRVLAGLAGRALPLLAAAVVFAVVAASCAATTRRRSPRPYLRGLIGAGAGLLIVVALRPASGLEASVFEGEVAQGRLRPGPVDFIGRDLQALPRLRRPRVSWEGELRLPESGTYRLWAEGRGRLEVRLDDWPVLQGEGDPLRVEARLALARGPHRLVVRLERDAPGARLRLGWVAPGAGGREAAGPRLVIPPRALGAAPGAAWWMLTDLLALLFAGFAAALVFVLPWTRPEGLPAPRVTTRAELAVSAAAYALLLVVMSWPLVTDPLRLGVTDRPDGRLNAWILAWDVHALIHSPARLFDAPAFHPLPDALAFSENLLIPAVLSAPFQWLGGPVLAYNAALFLSLLVSGLGTQALVRRVTGDRLAAFVAGALFAAGAHRWVRLAHLHAQVTLFLPLALLALDRFYEDRRGRSALLVGVLVALQGLSSVYLGAITALAVLSAAALMIPARVPPRDLVKLAAGFALAAGLLWPVMHPYLRMREVQGVEFTLDEVRTYATTLESYAASGTRLYGAFTQRHLEPERVQDTLFPGIVTLVLGLLGLAAAPRRYRNVAIAASLLAVLFSLGPATSFYRFLHEHVVLVRGVRALSRFSLVPVLSLCVLTGLFLAGRRWLVAVAALVLALVESSQVPLGYARWDGPSPAARSLAGGSGAVAVLPMGEDDTKAMLDGTAHFRPLVNGDSGFVPRPYARALDLLGRPPSEEGARLLRGLGVTQVVSAAAAVPFVPASDGGGDQVYPVLAGEAARVVAAGQPVATLWTGSGLLLDLGAPRSVGRVVFEVSDAAWVERPSVFVSLDGSTFDEIEGRASLADATLALYADPRHGRGEVRFPARTARFLRLGPRLPARRGALEVGE